jgi:hypothetical protein
MGLKVAIASGNWSNPAIWEGGTLPTPTDIVASNEFTVNIDQSVTVECITNIAHPPSAVPPMRTYIVGDCAVTTSGEYDASESYVAWKAFDFNYGLGESWISPNGFPAGWLAYEFKTPKAINQYIILRTYANTLSNMPRDWTFEGWSGSAWVILHTVTGNTALSYTGTFTNTTAYKKYRINITSNNGGSYTSIGDMHLQNVGDRNTPSVLGGTFTVNPGVTITCTQAGFLTGTTLLTFTTAGTYNLIGNIIKYSASNGIVVSAGNPTINIVGRVIASRSSGSSGVAINTTAQCTINITGDIEGGFENGGGCLSLNSVALCYITGNVTSNRFIGSSTQVAILVNTSSRCEIVGSVIQKFYPTAFLIQNESGLLSVIGTVNATALDNSGSVLIYNSYNSAASTLLSGPFIFSVNGITPVQVSRMHLIPTFNSYMEFRDSSTNGALPPAIQSPATRLVSPDTVADAPSPNNVRQGVSYSSGALTGTMIVPSPDNVSKNIPVDNTVGTAVLDPTAIWAVPLTSINTSNSIGRRVKNAATVETTGAQIQTTLNNNE